MRRRVVAALKLTLGLALVVWLVAQVDFVQLRELARAGQPRDLVLGMLAFVMSLVGFQALRLHVLVRRHTGGLRGSYRLFFIGALFNNVLPSNVGGDAARLYYLRGMGAGVGGALALLGLHRITGLAVLLAGAGAYALVHPARLGSLARGVSGPIDPVIVTLVLVGLGLAAALAARLSGLTRRLRQGWASARQAIVSLDRADWWMLWLLTLMFHGLRVVGLIWTARYLGQSADWFDVLFVLAVTGLAGLLPISVAGLGVMEGSMSYLLIGFGMTAPAAIACALVHRISLVLVALVGLWVYVASRSAGSAVTATDGTAGA